MSNTQRDTLAREIFLADNAGQSREASLKDWAEYNFATEQSYAHGIADGLIAAGWEKQTGDSFQLQATLTSGETVTVKVSGYSTMRQGCSALIKLADVQTLSQLIAGSENEEDWS